MSRIILSSEQVSTLFSGPSPVQVCDAKGNVLGTITPVWTPEEIAEAKRRAASPGPWFTSAQVQARLRALQEEWDRTGGFDVDYAREFMKKLNAADPGHMRQSEPS